MVNSTDIFLAFCSLLMGINIFILKDIKKKVDDCNDDRKDLDHRLTVMEIRCEKHYKD